MNGTVTSEEEIVPAVDNVHEDDDPNYLSISPRERLGYVEDREEVLAIERFDDIGSLRVLQRLLVLFRLEAIKQKPEDIIDFGCDFFSPQNREALRKMLVDEGMVVSFAGTTTSAGSPSPTMGRSPMTSGNQQMHDWSPQGK